MTWLTDTLQKDPRYGSPNCQRDTSLLFPPFLAKVRSVIAGLVAKGQTFEIIETYRSQERQHELFLQHATQLDKVGVHSYGLACDVVRIIGGRAHWEGALFADYGTEAEAVGLTWGGRWSFGDFGHVQYVTVEQQSSLFSGAWYPT